MLHKPGPAHLTFGRGYTDFMAMLTKSSPFVLIAAAFAGGVALAAGFSPHPWFTLCALLTGAAGCAHATRFGREGQGWLFGLLFTVGLGMARLALATPVDSADLVSLSGRNATLAGVVDSEPRIALGVTTLRLRVTRLATADGERRGAGGIVLVRVIDDAGTVARPWRYGEAVECEGALALPPRIDKFDYRAYLAREQVFLWMPKPDRVWRAVSGAPRGDAPALWRARLIAARGAARNVIAAILPNPESALLNGILIGDASALPQYVQDAFRRTGASHIIAISGYNVAVIVGAVLALLRRLVLPRKVAPVLIALLWLYALFVGASASVVRAVLMTTVALAGQLFWRRGVTLNTLCAAAFILLAADPGYLFDIGFQLSVAATLGLVVFADRLSEPVRALLARRVAHGRVRAVMQFVADGVLLTSAAQITTAPLIALSYGQFRWSPC